MARLERVASVETPASAPRYEFRVRRQGPVDADYEVWQLPAPATPHVTSPVRVAGLGGRNLQLVEHRVLKRLARAGVKLGPSAGLLTRGYMLTEDLALTLGLLFRALAPMRNRDNMRVGGRRHRGDGPRGGRLLAGHGHASPPPAAGTDVRSASSAYRAASAQQGAALMKLEDGRDRQLPGDRAAIVFRLIRRSLCYTATTRAARQAC